MAINKGLRITIGTTFFRNVNSRRHLMPKQRYGSIAFFLIVMLLETTFYFWTIVKIWLEAVFKYEDKKMAEQVSH